MNSESQYNLRSAYTYSGTFDPELWYICIFNEIPSRYEYEVKNKEESDLSKIDITFFNRFFPIIKAYRKFAFTTIGKKDEEDENISIIKESLDIDGAYYAFITDDSCWSISKTKVVVYYNSYKDHQQIMNLCKTIWEELPKLEPEEQKSKVSLIKCYQGDYYTESSEIRDLNIDIKLNYNDDFEPVYNDIIKFLNEPSSGLIILYGSPGCGKSSLIRHLCSVAPKQYVIVPQSIAMRLGDPELISFVTDSKNSIFILEDCEQLLEDRNENSWNSAISTILNMSDGLVGDIVNIKFICTFNAPITKIDPALLRKGRCIAKYEFKELAADKVEKLNEKYDLHLPEIKAMSLAEVFNSDSIDYTEKKKTRKIGF